MKYLALFLLLISSMSSAAEPRTYMVLRVSIDGATYGQVVFLYDRGVRNMAACEAEVLGGRRGHWEYYGHLLGTRKAFSTSATYQCIETAGEISAWYDRNPYQYIYMVDLRAGKFGAGLKGSYAECMASLRKIQPDESAQLFCAASNQKVMAPQQDAAAHIHSLQAQRP